VFLIIAIMTEGVMRIRDDRKPFVAAAAAVLAERRRYITNNAIAETCDHNDGRENYN